MSNENKISAVYEEEKSDESLTCWNIHSKPKITNFEQLKAVAISGKPSPRPKSIWKHQRSQKLENH